MQHVFWYTLLHCFISICIGPRSNLINMQSVTLLHCFIAICIGQRLNLIKVQIVTLSCQVGCITYIWLHCTVSYYITLHPLHYITITLHRTITPNETSCTMWPLVLGKSSGQPFYQAAYWSVCGDRSLKTFKCDKIRWA